MNRWDLFTYVAVGILVVGSVVVFGYFLRDARQILKEMGGNKKRPDPPSSPREPGD